MNWQDILKAKATSTHNSKGEKKDRCAKLADKKYGMKSSAYKSGYMVQCRNGKVSKAEGNLYQWYKKRAKGEKGEPDVKGWVSCQSCEDDKAGVKPCGRKDASKGTKQRCREDCDACKTYKRRKGSRRRSAFTKGDLK